VINLVVWIRDTRCHSCGAMADLTGASEAATMGPVSR
jgi:hypothetical protein